MLRNCFLTAISILALTAGCQSDQSAGDTVDLTFESRGVDVPATIVTPNGDGPFPLVVMAHGHGGSRHEGGGFEQVAEAMARHGIASIRMDFPGCGDSSEPFTENNLSNMLVDLQSARTFAQSRPDIDSNRVGLLGYSMGGRLVALLSGLDPTYKAMVMWTPAVGRSSQRELNRLGGSESWSSLKQRARDTGKADYITRWGTRLELGHRWFVDLEETRPLVSLANFKGPLLVLYGEEDDVVLPETSESAITAAENSAEVVRHVIPGAEHGLGFYTDRPAVAKDVVDTTAVFLSQRL